MANIRNTLRFYNSLAAYSSKLKSIKMSLKKQMSTQDGQLTPKLTKAIESISQREQFINHTVDAKILPADGGNFLGLLREVTISGETIIGRKELHLFIKTLMSEHHQAMYDVPKAYTTEVFAYKDLFKVFSEVQDQFNVPKTERFVTAKCYEESDSESIIMDNLLKRGFKTWNKMQMISPKFAVMAIEQLAKFHGLSIVLEVHRPDFFNAKVRSLKVPLTYGQVSWNEFVDNAYHLGLACLDPVVKERVMKYLPTTFEKYKRYTTDPDSFRCLVHGDFRTNNIMAKSNNDELIEVVPIDFQLIYYGCPVIDLIYFLFGATDQEFRREHMEPLKTLYHTSVAKYLNYFDVDVEKHYPRVEFERLWKERLDYGLMLSLWYVPIIYSDPGQVPDVTKVSCAGLTFDFNDVVRARVRGIVDDFIKWGYL